jgi:hypothetical protein
MDPLSVTASCIAIMQLSGSVISTCYMYRSLVKSSAKEAFQIIGELNNLRSIIDSLFVLREDEAESRPSRRSALMELIEERGSLE